MDCLVAMPVCTPSPAALQAYAQQCQATMPAAYVVGSPVLRSSMFLPRLCSIPEVDGGDDAVAGPGPLSDCQQHNAAAPAQGQISSSSCCQECLSTSAAAADSTAAPQDVSPAVVASTWAISIRHFTDCVPMPADSVCSSSGPSGQPSGDISSSCPGSPPVRPAGGTVSCCSSGQRELRTVQANCQAGPQQQQPGACSCSAPHSSSSSSSLLPAAEDEGGALGSEASLTLSGPLSLSKMDALEWQPWDRVVKWLELHNSHSEAVEGAVCSCAAAAVTREQGACSTSSRGGQSAGSADARPSSSSSSPRRDQSSWSAQPQQGQEEEEALFDAPEWWQESVKARLEEQREAFQSSWWCRLKISMGLAAQRAAA
jgi:hypothetical protein